MKHTLYILAALMTASLLTTACGDPDSDEEENQPNVVTPQSPTEANHDEMPG